MQFVSNYYSISFDSEHETDLAQEFANKNPDYKLEEMTTKMILFAKREEFFFRRNDVFNS